MVSHSNEVDVILPDTIDDVVGKPRNDPLTEFAGERALVSRHLVRGIASPARAWHSPAMPDYSLFGDEHVRQYETTGGKVGHDWNGAHCLILHTTARKSGQTRKFPLIYGRDGDDYVVVASKGGAPEHPGWYQNLVAQPDVKIQVRDKVLPVRARTGTAEDKKRVWPIMTAQWPDYDKYQAGTKRDIPVVLLSPR